MDFDVRKQVIAPFEKQFGVSCAEVEFDADVVDYVFEREGKLLDAFVRFNRTLGLYFPVHKNMGRGVRSFRMAAYAALKMLENESYESERKESAASVAKKRGTNVKRTAKRDT